MNLPVSATLLRQGKSQIPALTGIWRGVRSMYAEMRGLGRNDATAEPCTNSALEMVKPKPLSRPQGIVGEPSP